MGRGGKREGAGRPKKGNSNNFMVRITPDDRIWLEDYANHYKITYTEIIKMCIHIIQNLEWEGNIDIREIYTKYINKRIDIREIYTKYINKRGE